MSDTDDTEADRIQSLDDLARRQERTESKLDQLLGMFSSDSKLHKAAEEHTERRLDRGSSIQEAVQAELARAREREAAEKAQQTEKETLAQRLARLEEKPPAPPQPRREAIMWGRR